MNDLVVVRRGPVKESPLSAAFDEVWTDWLTLWRELASSSTSGPELATRAAEDAGMLARRLARLAQARSGAAAAAQIAATQFVFVALVDELLLFETWPGQASWHSAPLEHRLFGSRIAGEQIPDQIEQLLHERDPATRDLANVYLQGLLLGFHGRLRNGLAQHEEWRRALFSFAWQRDPDYRRTGLMLESPAALTPLRLSSKRTLPDGFRLAVILLLLLLAMLAAGHLFWLDIASHLRPLLSDNSLAEAAL